MPRTLVLLAAVFLFAISLFADPPAQLSSIAPKDETPKVRCPAIEFKMTGTNGNGNSLGERQPHIELVVVATVENTGEKTRQLKIEKSIFGGDPGKTITMQSDAVFPLTPRVYVLKSNFKLDEAEFKFRDELSLDEEKGQRALAYARLAVDTLSSYSIVVAKEVSAADPHAINIKIERTILGHTFRSGEQIAIGHQDFPDPKDEPGPVRLKTSSMIYILKEDDADEGEKKIYPLARRLYPSAETEIAAIYKNRNNLPIRQPSADDPGYRYREVALQGTAEDAIELLGSGEHDVVDLASDALTRDAEKTLPLVIAATKKEIASQDVGGNKTYDRLRNLIQYLRKQNQNSANGPLDQLLAEQIASAAVESWPLREPRRGGSEEYNTRVNHGVTWLMTALEPRDMIKHAPQILAARENAKLGAKQELDLAVATCDISFQLELLEALKTKHKSTLVTEPTPLAHGDSPAFSPDGKLFAIEGQLYRFPELTPIGDPFESYGQFFSPTGKSLFVRSHSAGGLIEYDLAGKALRTLKIRTNYESISADGARILSDDAAVIELATGKTIRSFKTEGLEKCTLSPDGKLFARTGDDSVFIAPVDDPKNPGKEIAVDRPDRIAITPDGKSLVVVGWNNNKPDKRETDVFVFDTADSHKVAKVALPMDGCSYITFAPDGKRALFCDGRGQLICVDFPQLTNPKRVFPDVVASPFAPSGAAFSPDGKYLVVGQYHESPRFYRTDTFEPVIFGEAHGTQVRHLRFAPDGKTFRTFAADSICTWDTATLKLVGRKLRNEFGDYISVSPDGLHYICFDKTIGDGNLGHPSRDLRGIFVETDAGKVLGEHLFRDFYRDDQIVWLPDRQILYQDADGKNAACIDAMTGKVIEAREVAEGKKLPPAFAPSAISIYDFKPRGYRFEDLEFKTLDPKTGDIVAKEKFNLPHEAYNAKLIAGDKYICFYVPGVVIVDRASLKVLLDLPINSRSFGAPVFSPDHSRFAVQSYAGRYSVIDSHVTTLHDALSGKIVAAIRTGGDDISFSPDGRHLFVIHRDGSVVRIELPK